jgi:hypothetical protein
MLWPTRVFIFAAPVSAMPAVTSTVHSLAGFDQRSQTHAAIINSLGATKLRLVAPSALVPSFSLAGRGHRLACLPIALPNYSFRAEWSKLLGGQARVSNAESNHSSNPP